MKCHDIRQILIAYLDNEATPYEQRQIQQHIVGCADCQAEMAALQGLQSYVYRSLKIEAAQAAPSQGAWDRLQANLAAETINPPVSGKGLLHRLGLLGSNHQGTYRNNKPASNNPQGWSSTTTAVQDGWHQRLIWATRWSTKARADRRLKQGFIPKNRYPNEPEDDILK